jgi:hypothetical protein
MTMHDDPDLAVDETFGGSTLNPAVINLIGQIGEAIEESKRDQHLDLAIPGTNDLGEEGENLIPVDDTIPIRFELRLAQLFLKDAELLKRLKTARDIILAIFPTEQAVIAANVEVSTWMQNLNKRLTGEMVGE